MLAALERWYICVLQFVGGQVGVRAAFCSLSAPLRKSNSTPGSWTGLCEFSPQKEAETGLWANVSEQ